ncbi:MAG: hypothetical protein Q8P03_00090 [bacterium]|nr:hypothetical protein [bacterium]
MAALIILFAISALFVCFLLTFVLRSLSLERGEIFALFLIAALSIGISTLVLLFTVA